MTTTSSLDRIGGSAEDISVLKLAEAGLFESRNEALPNGGSRTTYTLSSGDNRYPTTVVVQAKPDTKGNGGKGMLNALLALNTWARTETDGAIDIIEPISAVLSFSVPLNAVVEIADVHDMIENLFSLTYTTVTTKEGDNARISSLLLFGITKVF